MEANMIILRTQHYKPAMRHHKNVAVHSSVRLPALQAKVGPPPGSARVAVVGAGVVLACALGAMYWKRARAQPIIRSNPTCHVGKNGSGIASRDVLIEKLPELLYQICLRTLDSERLPDLTDLFSKCLIEKEKTNALEKKILDSEIGEHEYYCGLVLTLALINEKEYEKAKCICNKLQHNASDKDPRPKFLLAVIDKMKEQSPGTPSASDMRTIQKLVDDAWKEIKETEDTDFPRFGDAPPSTN